MGNEQENKESKEASYNVFQQETSELIVLESEHKLFEQEIQKKITKTEVYIRI